MNYIKKIINKFTSKSIPDDDFIKRLRSLIIGDGMLQESNIYLIDHAIKNMPDEGKVLEIGSYGGLSINLILHLIKKHKRNNRVLNCDPWVYEGYHDHKGVISNTIDGKNDIERTSYSKYMKEAYINAVNFLSPDNLPYTFQLYSNDFFEKWKLNESVTDIFDRQIVLEGQISFAYIDGGHSYEQAWKDFENVSGYLIKGGYILFDDSADYLNFGSSAMMSMVKKDKRFIIVDKKNNYLIKKI